MCLAILHPVAVLAQSVSFSPATNFAVGTGPASVAIGDLNGDGKPDLVAANYFSNNVSVLLGTGTGSFGPATNFVVGTSPYFVTIGDLNGDGKPDLATANVDSNNVSILLGTGTGSFGLATNLALAVGAIPRSLAIGDLNGDGKPDLAVANGPSDNVSILLGTGTGSFGLATNLAFAAGAYPFFVAIGDLNGDGKPDLAVSNAGESSISILLGDGTGSFGAATNLAVGVSPLQIAIGDLNGDGKPDLAVASNDSSGNVSILLNTGAGAFSAATNVAAGSNPFSVAIGDINGDGKPDLAVANLPYTGNTASILLGDGTGSFGAATNFAVGTSPSPASVAIGDLDADGKPDLVVANHFSNSVSILLNTTNQPPVANAGPNQVVQSASPSGTSVTLDGSASSDPDGDTLAFEWKDASNNVIGNAAVVNVTAPLGTTTYTLKITDPGGLSATATTDVTVQDTISPAIVCGAADGLWHANNVSINCTATDGGSGPALQNVALSTSVAANTEDANASTNSQQVCDAVGNCATAGPVAGNKVDRKGPTVTLTSPANGVVFMLNQSANASYSCVDGGSGLAACTGTVANGSSLDTATVGTKTFTVNATDLAGNSSSVTNTYTVQYQFGGFLAPVDNLPVVNKANSGRTIPIKWQLKDANGAEVSDLSSLTSLLSAPVACDAAPVAIVEEELTAPGSTVFRYTGGQFIYNWQTSKSWSGCRVLQLTFSDGTQYFAKFNFK